MEPFDKLVAALREYSECRKGEIARITSDAADAIEALQARLGEAENSVERWKDMYLTKHEPKLGKWIHGREIGKEWAYDHWIIYYEDWHCSNCKVVFEQDEKPKYNYCPNCGAKMTEVQDAEI